MVEHSQILKTNDFLSYRTLIWRRFRKNRMGIIALVILGIFYFSAVFAEYFAPYDHKEIQIHRRHVPPQKIYYNLSDGLYVHGLITTKNPKTLELEYKKNTIYGMIECYTLALPFFSMTLLSTFIFSYCF